jgi:hypothetical protein
MSLNINIFGDSDSCYSCKVPSDSPTIKPISPFTSRSLQWNCKIKNRRRRERTLTMFQFVASSVCKNLTVISQILN